MKLIFSVVILFTFHLIIYPQEATKIALIHETSYDLIDAENKSGVIYVSFFYLISICIPHCLS